MNVLYTAGYTGSKPDDLRQYAMTLGAMVMDIRYSRRSRVPHWDGDALWRFLGAGRYRPVPELGNVNYRNGGPIELAEPDVGVELVSIYLEEHPCIFLCACAEWRDCHRTVAANLIAEATGAAVVHLPGRYADWSDTQP